MGRGVNRRKKKKTSGKGSLRGGLFEMFQTIVISIVIGSCLFAAMRGIESVGELPVFHIKKIEWRGLEHLEEAEMRMRFHSVLGKNIFRLDLKKIQKKLLVNRWIKEVTIKKAFPDRLIIIVVERKPASVEYDAGGAGQLVDLSIQPLLLDREGEVLQVGFPEAGGGNGKDSGFGDEIGNVRGAGAGAYARLPRLIAVNRRAYPRALILGEVLQDRPEAYIDLTDPDDLVVYLSLENGNTLWGRLHLGKKYYQERWEKFLAIEADLHRRGLSRWEIDLRISGKIIVKTGDGIMDQEMLPTPGNAPDAAYF